MYVIVVGLSGVGQTLSKLLLSRGHTVAVIDRDEARCKEFASEVDALIINGDAEDKENLINAGIEKANALVAATNDDSVNLMVVTRAKDFGVPKLMVVLRDVEHADVFSKMGVEVVTPDAIVAEHIYQSLFEVGDFLYVGKCGSEVFSIQTNENTEVIHKKIKDLRLPNGYKILAVIRKDKLNLPDENLTIEAGDDIVVYTDKPENLKRVVDIFTKKSKKEVKTTQQVQRT
ncbi:hypothetical protein DRO26_00345 [Candidatus Bathyarchaeota archaeon]|nr:MAG: hypothetical protein DRO26_00345 [Candidatus Bathyarchaeota archaeon]